VLTPKTGKSRAGLGRVLGAVGPGCPVAGPARGLIGGLTAPRGGEFGSPRV
jgi:hypothetical protein